MKIKYLLIVLPVIGLWYTGETKKVYRAAEKAQDTWTVRYLAPDSEDDMRREYFREMLDIAMEETADDYGDYELIPADQQLSELEALRALQWEDDVIDVAFGMTETARERFVRPVRVPVLKGLLGTRMIMVRDDETDLLNEVSSIEDLRSYQVGQGEDWPDTRILNANGLDVHTSDGYNRLFEQLADGDFDLFPRGINEVWDELETFGNLGLALAEHVYIQYPTATYFFVAQGDRELANRIDEGLHRAIDNGRFDALFEEYYGDVVDRANLDEKQIIQIDNPYLPEDTPTDNPDYWHDIIED